MPRHHVQKEVSRLLDRLVESARTSERPEDAEALLEFGTLALISIPKIGVFVPNDNEVAIFVERVAKDHLGLKEARRSFHQALKVVTPFEHRDEIETAHNRVESVTDEAYFYAGLVFGMTLADFS